MALCAAVGFSGGFCHLGRGDSRRYGRLGGGTSLGWRLEAPKFGKLDGEGFLMKTVYDEIAASPSSSSSGSSFEAKTEMGNGGPSEELKKRKGDFKTLPKPLSATDVSASNNGSNMRVAYQGLPGAFSESAALKAYPECETVPCNQFEVAFKAVELGLVDKAVLPIENTFGGSVHRNYDLLLRHTLHIVGEVQLYVDYCLMALPGVQKKELKRVLSHPLALAQCNVALSELGVAQENAVDTATAAQFVSTNGSRDVAAVASSRAASIYGLDILEEKIQDNHNSMTRFLILAREPIIPRMGRPFKTSIIFTLEEGPGVISKALLVFAMRNINLFKIESRPQRKRPLRVVDDSNGGTSKYFDYLFYIDFEASMADPRAQSALAHLQEYSKFLRVLGSYPFDIYL